MWVGRPAQQLVLPLMAVIRPVLLSFQPLEAALAYTTRILPESIITAFCG